jgi:hypothetical protein
MQDERLETAAAIQAAPNMTGAPITPVLRPFGSYQLITALNGLYPETGTIVYYYRHHGYLAAFDSRGTK